MRAAVFIKPGQPLEIQNLPDPEPGPGEVVLRIERCGICGTDLHFTEGHGITYPSNFVPGHENCAEVVALGKDVDCLKVGDHVVPHPIRGCGTCPECLAGSPFWCPQVNYNMGGFAQYKTSVATACIRVPAGLSLKDAAIVEPLSCGLDGVMVSGMKPGASVLVIGAGPIGLAAIFWARRAGAGHIVASAKTTQREELARAMGADEFFTIDELADRLSTPPEFVFECAGVPGAIVKSVDVVAKRGTVVGLGACSHPETFIPANAMMKEITLRFAVGTTLKEFQIVADTLAAGHVEPLAMVTDTVSLDQLPAAFEALRSRSTQCKVLVDPWK